MGCTRISQLNEVRVTRGPGGEIVAAREHRRRRSDKGLPCMLNEPDRSAKSSSPSQSEPRSVPRATRQGQTEAIRSERSRKTQLGNVLDCFPGYVLAYSRGSFRFVSLRTPAGTTLQQGHRAMVHLRTGLEKRFPFVDGLVLQPDLFDESIEYVQGSAWHADYSLEASDNGSPHFHLMVALFGYDPGAFESAIYELWNREVKAFLQDSAALGPNYVHVGRHLGADTVQYMVGHKRTRSGGNAHDFSRWLREGESLGTNWHGAMGGPCRALVKGHGEYLDHESVKALRARAIIIDEVKWGGHEVPDKFSHFQDRATGARFYVVSGPWLGSAARYLATGSLLELADYRRALLQSRRRRRNRLKSTGATSAEPYQGIR